MEQIGSAFNSLLRTLGLSGSTDTSIARPPPPQPGARPTPTQASNISPATRAPPPQFGVTQPLDSRPTSTTNIRDLIPLDVPTVVEIALILSHVLPRDVIPIVLDFAELWPIAAGTRRNANERVMHRQAGTIVAALVMPPYIAPGSVRRIRFITLSKDQGWSSYRENYGTYENSWTWFEAGVCRKENSTRVPPLTVDLELNPSDPGDGVFKRVCNHEDYDHAPQRIVTNVHAGQSLRVHTIVWDASHDDPEIRRIVKNIRSGQRIEVSAWAMYPGWINDVRQITIEVECQFVRKM